MLKDLAIKSRSYRGFDSSVRMSQEDLIELVECARFCPSAMNRQPLRYILSCDDEKNIKIFKETNWAMRLKNKVPYKGQEPCAYIVICVDSNVNPNPESCGKDVGIVAQTMMLKAVEMGFGGCMIGAFDTRELTKSLELDERYKPSLILALGKPCEQIVLVDSENDDTNYYRDENDIHHVPKRKLSELIIL